jgi:hypothetical protein
MSNNPKYLIVHHSASSPHETVQSLRAFHIEKRGWSDIGYHKLILNPEGINTEFKKTTDLIKQGRPDSIPGAHCPGYNSKSLGICLVGNFMSTSPPPEMLEALETCIRILMKRYKIPAKNIKAHRELYATECPGAKLFKKILELRSRLEKE